MADIDTGSGGGKGKKGKGKKLSTKVDMTPMVDLAFLLITFFMLTTAFSKPQTMEVNYPDKNDKEDKMEVKASKTMTILLAQNDRILYYIGLEKEIKETDYSPRGIRKLLLDRKKTIDGPIYVIKAKKDATYKNLVDMLDEMTITKSTTFAVVPITPDDLALIDKSPGALPAAQ